MSSDPLSDAELDQLLRELQQVVGGLLASGDPMLADPTLRKLAENVLVATRDWFDAREAQTEGKDDGNPADHS